ncbi:MAG: hypothetical protein FWH26_01440 [Oscillospiraceae bacterium]|nr:hypothetical protein [Oscillospiraceae bacterium]
MNIKIRSADLEREMYSWVLWHDASSACGISDPVYDESGTGHRDRSYFSLFSTLSAAWRSILSADSGEPEGGKPLFALLRDSREERRQFREKIRQA